MVARVYSDRGGLELYTYKLVQGLLDLSVAAQGDDDIGVRFGNGAVSLDQRPAGGLGFRTVAGDEGQGKGRAWLGHGST